MHAFKDPFVELKKEDSPDTGKEIPSIIEDEEFLMIGNLKLEINRKNPSQ